MTPFQSSFAFAKRQQSQTHLQMPTVVPTTEGKHVIPWREPWASKAASAVSAHTERWISDSEQLVLGADAEGSGEGGGKT